MFSSGFAFGFTLSDVTAQVTAFLSNPVVWMLFSTGLALIALPRIIRAVLSSLRGPGWTYDTSDAMAIRKSIHRHHRRHSWGTLKN